MTLEVIKRLNSLNQHFYTQIADEFDATRQEYWPGWEELLPQLKSLSANPPVKVLDVGCGNGRFGEFLAEKIGPNSLKYTGTDLNSNLLAKAETKLVAKGVTATFKPQDIVELAVAEQLSPVFGSNSYNLIALLGVMHHLPSEKLRLSLLDQLVDVLQPGGLLVFATWQFMEFARLSTKRVEPSQVGFSESELEPNDYFLSWERGEVAYRYCHYFDEAEHRRLVTHLESTCNLIHEFRADGKEGNMNHYFVFQKLA